MLRSMGEAQHGRPADLVRSALQLVALGALLLASLWIVRPFLSALIWATMLAVAGWPLLVRAQAWFGGRRSLAVASITLVLLLVLVIPLYLGVRAAVNNAGDVPRLAESLATYEVPAPPDWLEGVPLVGKRVAAEWRQIAAEGPTARAERITPYARDIARWLVAEVGSLGALVVHFLLTVILAAILFSRGEAAADGALRFARRLAGAEGEKAVTLAGQAVRAVALGVVLTALLQTALVAVGFFAIGVPFAAVLTIVSFVLSVAQIGPIPLLIGAVIWTYSSHGAAWGTAYLVWAAVCGLVDNFVRPVLIKRGANLPLLLIFAGVIGGLLAFGVVGLFVGPVVLAVGYTLLVDWMDEPAG
jgi:predicted PurR-regulated permease PerM